MSEVSRGQGYATYSKETFTQLARQHNIMVLVGNGFDLQVLHDYEQPIDSRYSSFFYYLKMRQFNPRNLLLQHMEKALADGLENWSDIEAAVDAAVAEGKERPQAIFQDLLPMQAYFADFLQGVVPNSLLSRLGQDAVAHEWSVNSLSRFLEDITDGDDFRSMRFPIEAGTHYHLFNFLFVNFNYTTLLDNYVYLDQQQFKPLKHKTVDTNFLFLNDPRGHLNPRNATDEGQSSYVLTDVVHPHGVLSTPRSLLFGIDADDGDRLRDPYKDLKKPYWAQSNALFRSHFAQTELFIIFGCSLGDSDGWWWRNVAQAMKAGDSELIIYRRQGSEGHTEASIKRRFLEVAGMDEWDPKWDTLEKKIHVVIYEDSSDRNFLNTRRA